jgi:hypothetical protein
VCVCVYVCVGVGAKRVGGEQRMGQEQNAEIRVVVEVKGEGGRRIQNGGQPETEGEWNPRGNAGWNYRAAAAGN